MTDPTPVPGDGPTERETLTEAEIEMRCRREQISHEHYTREVVERIKADAYDAGLAARTPAPSAAQAQVSEIRRLLDHWDAVPQSLSGIKNADECVRYDIRQIVDRLDAAPTDPGTRRVEVVVYDQEPGPEVTEVEDGSGDRWRRGEDGWWHLLVLGGSPESHDWPALVEVCDEVGGPFPVGTAVELRARLRTPGTTEEGQG